jgi:hypothetical protein
MIVPSSVRLKRSYATRGMFHEIPGRASNKPVKKGEMLSHPRELKI